MRRLRLKIPSDESEACYHCVSRVVNRDYVFGHVEKDRFRKLMRRHERLCQVRVLTYCVMSNHFHILVMVPKRPASIPPDDGLLLFLERCGYSGKDRDELRVQLGRFRSEDNETAAEALRQRWWNRMWDVSQFMKGLKQEFTQWFNRVHARSGTLWEERFRSVLVEGTGEALQTVAAYIDLNSVRAALADDPKDYRWCGYAEAMAGGQLALAGIREMARSSSVHTSPEPEAAKGMAGIRVEEGLSHYRMLLFGGAESEGIGEEGRPLRRGVPRERIREVLKNKGRLTASEMVLCRVRYFCDGAVLGSAQFVNETFQRERWRFGPHRRDGARKMRFVDAGGLRVLRDLQVDVV